MQIWQQIYDLLGNAFLSTVAAAVPVIVFPSKGDPHYRTTIDAQRAALDARGCNLLPFALHGAGHQCQSNGYLCQNRLFQHSGIA